MNSTTVFLGLLAISISGLVLGSFYYFYPEKIVNRRIGEHHRKIAKKDKEFRKWLELEKQTQLKRTRSMGMVLIIVEAIMLVLILGLWRGE